MENTPDATAQLFLLNYESKTNRPATRNARPGHCCCRAATADWLRDFAAAKMAFGRRQGKTAGNRASGQSGKSPERAGIPHIPPYSGGNSCQACRRAASCRAACCCSPVCLTVGHYRKFIVWKRAGRRHKTSINVPYGIPCAAGFSIKTPNDQIVGPIEYRFQIRRFGWRNGLADCKRRAHRSRR